MVSGEIILVCKGKAAVLSAVLQRLSVDFTFFLVCQLVPLSHGLPGLSFAMLTLGTWGVKNSKSTHKI